MAQQLAKSSLKVFNEIIGREHTQKFLAQALGDKKSSFVNNLTALVSNNAKLQECDPPSLMYAGIKATALDLPLDSNLGFAYVIPYNNTKAGKVEAQFQIGYKGFIQLAIRSGQFQTINVTDIREGELREVNIVTGEIQFQSIPNREKKEIIGYVAYFRLTNGFSKILYMTKGEVEEHAKRYSQTYQSQYETVRASSKWTTDFDPMAKKTVLKLLLAKYAPLSVEMQEAQRADQAVVKENGVYEYDDNDVDAQAELENEKEAAAAEAEDVSFEEIEAEAEGKKPESQE